MKVSWRFSGVPAAMILFFGLNLPQIAAQESPKDLTELPLEDLTKLEVYSASKFSQKMTEAPASISIISAADIQHYGYRKLSEILNSAAGFYSTNDRNYEYLGVRGFGRTGDYNTRVLFLLNGLRLNESIYGGTGIGFDFPLDVNLIERIEIVRGPGSSLYGTNAFFGTVNIITKRGRSLEGGRIYLEGGSMNTYSGNASYGKTYLNGIEVLFSATYQNSKGQRKLYFSEFDTPETNNGIAEDLDTESSADVYANIATKHLTTQFVFNTREKGIPTASYGTTFNDRAERTKDSVGYIDVKYERTLRHNWNVVSRAYLGIYSYDGVYGYTYPSEESNYFARNLDLATGRWWGGEFQLTRTLAGKHHLTIGSEFQHSFHTHQRNYDTDPNYFSYLDTSNPRATVGAYLQGEFALRENLLINAGFRHDYYSTFGGNASPRFAIVYSPRPKTTLKLMYGHAFRAPNTYETSYEDGYSQKTNPNLEPEKIRTTEFVVEQYFGNRFRLAGSAYHYHVRDLITQQLDLDGLSIFRNADHINAQGIELAFEGKDFHSFDTRLSYALQRTRGENSPEILANSPKHIAQLNMFLPCFYTRGGAGVELRYTSSRKALAGDRLGGYLMMNASLLFKNLLPNLDVTAGVYNLFDKRYADPAGAELTQNSILQNGRSFRIRVGYGLGVNQ
jgi:outer membrane receptor for ferrienterochelin and colicins